MRYAIVILAMAAGPALCGEWRDSGRWAFEDHETIHQTFAGGTRIEVNNLNGYIHVTGYSGSEVRVTAERRTQAKSKSALEAAKREVSLELSQQGGTVRVRPDGCCRSSSCGCQCDCYHVVFDFDIELPRDAALNLKTLNGGIEVKGTRGRFDVHGLNGRIDMDGIGGSGSVHTLNGKVKVTFANNPAGDTEFHTLNGPVDVYFQHPLDANLKYRTLNGGVWADFDVTVPASEERSGNGMRKIYGPRRPDHSGELRAGKGGPLLSFNGLNGTIRLHAKAE